jgi:predicted HTH domain antitoxin
METLRIEIPENVRPALKRTPEEMARDMRLYTALMLFRQGKLSSGAAAELAGVPRILFFDLCGETEDK